MMPYGNGGATGMDFEIIDFDPAYTEAAKDLLVELQSYIASLDGRGVIVLKDNFRDGYFDFGSAEVEKQNGRIFLAIKCGRAVGIVICKIFQGGGEEEFTSTCPKVGFISDLAVTERERRQGIGRALLSRAEQFFSERGCEYTQLEVFAPNRAALSLYESCGFFPLCHYLSKKCGNK